jgi:hypothetical protein
MLPLLKKESMVFDFEIRITNAYLKKKNILLFRIRDFKQIRLVARNKRAWRSRLIDRGDQNKF